MVKVLRERGMEIVHTHITMKEYARDQSLSFQCYRNLPGAPLVSNIVLSFLTLETILDIEHYHYYNTIL